eukprot:g16033.t1
MRPPACPCRCTDVLWELRCATRALESFSARRSPSMDTGRMTLARFLAIKRDFGKRASSVPGADSVLRCVRAETRPRAMRGVDPCAGYVLGTVKTSNATYGHHGEMAWQQTPDMDMGGTTWTGAEPLGH